MHKASLALAILGSSLSLYAQTCNAAPTTQRLETYYPWQASFYYGNTANNSLMMFFDITVTTPITFDRMLTCTYDWGVGNPPVPDQTGNVAEVRIFFVPGTRVGNETTQANWGVDPAGLGTMDGLPEYLAELTFVTGNGDTPIQNFKDPATGTPVAAYMLPGTYGVALEIIPTTWSGTAALPQTNIPLLNPGAAHVLGVSPNPGTTWSDQFVSINNDAIAQNGWTMIDPLTGAESPNPAPNGPQDSINLVFEYTPSDPTAAYTTAYGDGCYDSPRMFYELIASGTNPVDLIGTSWTMLYQPSGTGGNYLVVPGGPAFDVSSLQSPVDLTTLTPSTNAGTNWDDAGYIHVLSTTLFPTGFPYPGSSCTEFNINSNGKVFLGSMTDNSWDSNGANYGSLASFQGALANLTLPAQLAAFSCDLDPSSGGHIWLEEPSPNGGVRVTYELVPNWPAVTGRTCNMQIEFLPTGMITMAFGSDLVCDPASNVNDALVGFSAGYGEPMGTSLDWSAVAGYQSGDGGQAPVLSMMDSAGIPLRPVIGTSPDVVISNLTPGTGTPIGGFVTVSLNGLATPLPLGTYGLAGCNAHIDISQVLFTVFLGNPGTGDMRWTWNIPVLPASVLPIQANFQGGTLTPNPYNTKDFLLTNGLCTRIGS